jgi:hypothetical protein
MGVVGLVLTTFNLEDLAALSGLSLVSKFSYGLNVRGLQLLNP